MHNHVAIQTVHVFTNTAGQFGDTVGVVVDEGRNIDDGRRQKIARELDMGEVVFINDVDSAQISVVHPQGEIDFAGTAVLGAAWLITELLAKKVGRLRGRAGDIGTRQDGMTTWVRAEIAVMPPWRHRQLAGPDEVDAFKPNEAPAMEHTMLWAWLNEGKGRIRARTFASDWDIPEPEANGSGSMLLAAHMGRHLEIRHGKGSVIYTQPLGKTSVELGGRVIEGKRREV